MTGSNRVSPVVLCGGSGTRLWPVSRTALPKQFTTLMGDESLLAATCRRVAPYVTGPWVTVSHVQHRFLVAAELRSAGVESPTILLEPSSRNTAPAIAAAALAAQEDGSDPVLLIMPSDHRIEDDSAFGEALDRAIGAAADGHLVTLGVVPTHPATGYGYIRPADPGQSVSEIDAFVEKPDASTAADYVSSGRYLWNSGMFVFRASRFLAELRTHRPAMVDAVERAWRARHDASGFVTLGSEAFGSVAAESVDYAVFENVAGARVVTLDAGWSDIGSWDALWMIGERDQDGNVLLGDTFTHDVQNSYVRAERRLVAAVGMRDHVVVETADAVLVVPIARAQDVRVVVERLLAAGRSESVRPAREPRPWGDFESLDSGPGYQVKRITVRPGGALSVQKHHHRAEHWTVVQGTAHVRCDDREFDLLENEGTFIPLGSIHRLENRGLQPLILIEVQYGSYLGEDDIVRLEDQYGRSSNG